MVRPTTACGWTSWTSREQSQESEEVQLTGKAFDSRLHYVAGVFYFHESGFVHDWVPFDGGLLMVDGNNLMDTTSYAGYAHADYEVTDKLGITVGARWSLRSQGLWASRSTRIKSLAT